MEKKEVKNERFDVNNWKEYFEKVLFKDLNIKFLTEENVNITTVRSYEQVVNTYTNIIKIGFLDKFETLIYIELINVNTIGFTKFQENDIQYFEEGMLDEYPEFGEPGLSFEKNHIKLKKAYLDDLDGKEIQYYSEDNMLIKSEIIFSKNGDLYTYKFHKEKNHKYIKEYVLHEIFKGIIK